MKKLSLLVFVMMATWMVTSCSTTTSKGCYGFWKDNRWGMKRGTIVGKNADYKRPYRQCVEKEEPNKNTEKRPYG